MLPVLPLLVAAAAPAAPYEARGDRPVWQVTIRENGIRLAFSRGSRSHIYGHAVARNRGGSRHWEAGAGVAVISVDARPGRCRAGGRLYPDVVRVRLSGRELNGCGGERIGGRRR